MTIKLQSHYVDLGPQFSRLSMPKKQTSAVSLLWNDELAEQLNLDIPVDTRAAYFSGSLLFEGSKPTSMAYSGHQFGHFNPQLGDGRAHLLGELIDRDGFVKELHLKGSGQTPFSRNGDGKCGIKPAVREYLMSEALYALGVPTTRSLSVVTTGESLMRQHPTTGAVVTRVATSHLRVGTFEYFAARKMYDEIKILTDLCISRHDINLSNNNHNKYINLLAQVIDNQIFLVTEWMRIGFIHGVLNTDNTLLSGETIDYGPCAMMGAYDPSTVFSSIDHNGRYAYGNQASILQWNMARLAECLLPLIDADEKKAVNLVMPLLQQYPEKFTHSYHNMMAKKLGFQNSQQLPQSLLDQLLDTMYKNQLDYTQTFTHLNDALANTNDIAKFSPQMTPWYKQWIDALKSNEIKIGHALLTMAQSNPLLIPRNHHVEAVLTETEKTLNNKAVLHMLDALKSPYKMTKNTQQYQSIDARADLNYQTFCGT
ncbi:protein adenylyltransferase SelO [Marinicella litoralis]|uniref:Protein nucleotidyltransferase YdiU n=1 Tax=Marinicella litoralis TaxID=644220 RepID=A0A4R6XHW6_9GAMM|nr:YdiU family protein [Marinicella litoralis]TDR17470.1 uncharacterized protein YdiU (UPF0061 family) [Marinicella litoralis]